MNPASTAVDGWRNRAIAAEKSAMTQNQQLLQARALIHRARQQKSTVIPVGDLQDAVGDPTEDEPNSITEWARQGKLDELIRSLRELNRRRRSGEVI